MIGAHRIPLGPLGGEDGRRLDMTQRPLVMGILNCTPDSFYPASRRGDSGDAAHAALDMIEAGADIIDVGGESTRPGADYVDADEETRRVVPVIRAIRRVSPIPISIDTRKRVVAEAALDAGADIVNDVSGLRDDPDLRRLAAERGAPVVLMHMRGSSKTMQRRPRYDDAVAEVRSELIERVEIAVEAGVPEETIILDPGIGFGKRAEDNLAIIANLSMFVELGRPVLIGISRKSFVDAVLDRAVEDRLAGSLAAEAYAVLEGAHIVRVHDVRETVDLVRMITAIRRVAS